MRLNLTELIERYRERLAYLKSLTSSMDQLSGARIVAEEELFERVINDLMNVLVTG